MPNYNKEKKIGESIASVINQDYKDWELIIVDNHSTDNSESVIHSYLSDERIKLIKIHNGGSIGKSRNLGIRLSKYKYLAFLDSDDTWETNKLSESLEYLLKGYDFIHHFMGKDLGIQLVHKKFIKNCENIDNISPTYLLNYGNPFVTSSVVLLKDLLNSDLFFDENVELSTLEDFDLWFRLFIRPIKVKFINKSLGTRTIDLNNTTSAFANYKALKYFFNKYRIYHPNINCSEHLSILYHFVRSSYLLGLDDQLSLCRKLIFVNSDFSIKFKLLYMYIKLRLKNMKFE